MTENHRNESPSWLGWAATAAGGVGLLFGLAALGQPMILIGSFDVVLPAVLGVAAIVVALRVEKPHRLIGLITGALAVLLAVVILGVLLFADPWDEDDNDDVVDEQGSSSGASSSSDSQPAAKQGRLMESGFGQNAEQVGLAAIVKNVSDHTGQTVNISFNVKDTDGELLETVQESGYFSWKGQELAIVAETSLDEGEKVGSVETTLIIEDSGSGDDQESSNLGTADAELVSDGYGGSTAKVKVKNRTKNVLKNPYIAVVCRDGGGKIAGSGYTFPDLIGAGSEYADDASVTVSPDAESCKSYMTLSNLS